jgi:cytochrome c-type biogenesis protein CcmH/NrfG
MENRIPAMSLSSRTFRLTLAAAAAVAVFVALTAAIHLKDTPSPAVSKAPAAESAQAPVAGVDSRHEAMALESQLQKKPNHVPILTRLAQIARENGKPAEAIPYLRKIIQLEPKNTEARLELGRNLYDTGDVTGAMEQTNQILNGDPKNVDALYNMGAIYANSSKPEVARDYWKRAVASDPSSDSGKRAAQSLQRLSGSDK